MTQSTHWVGTCRIAALTPTARRWEGETDEAIADVVVFAEVANDIGPRINSLLSSHDLRLNRLANVEPLSARLARTGENSELADLVQRVTDHSPLIFARMRPILNGTEVPLALINTPDGTPAPHGTPANVSGAASCREIGWDPLTDPTAPRLWAIVDGVNCREVSQKIAEFGLEAACLYTTTDGNTAAMAPWLVRVRPNSPELAWLRSLPHDQHWGILLQSYASMAQLRAHFRKFTMLWTPANTQAPVYFRFYDPRVAMDLVQALEAWKLQRFLMPVKRLVAPLSPLMCLPEALDLTAPVTLSTKAEECRNRLICIEATDPHPPEAGRGQAISIGETEFARFTELQREKASHKMARGFLEAYADQSPDDLLAAVKLAGELGARYAMTSLQQVRTLAKCVLEFGPDFPLAYRDAAGILQDRQTVAWRKRDLLEAWIPRGRVRRDLLMDQVKPGVQDIDWNTADRAGRRKT